MTSHEPLDLQALSHDDRYKFLMASVVPRPIALVTTLGETGVVNAAPFSTFIVLSIDPPLLGMSVATQRTGGLKDTRRNIDRTGEFVINTVTTAMAEQVQRCGDVFAPEVSEVQEAGLHILPSDLVGPPRIAESPLQFECRLHRCVEFGARKSALLVGEVVRTHAAVGLVQGHHVDARRLDAIGRLAGRTYCRVQDVIAV